MTAGLPNNVANQSWALQAAQGTAAPTSQTRLYLQTGSSQVHAVVTKADYEETTGTRMIQDSYVSEIHAEGAPVFSVMPTSIGSLLYGVLGAKAVTGAADPWTHTFTNTTTLPYLTFWTMLGNLKFEAYKDCLVTGMVIHGESGLPLTVTPTVMGLSPNYLVAAEATAAIESTNRFMHYDASGALLFEGAPVACVRSFTIAILNNAEVIPGDSFGPCDVALGRFEVTIDTETLVTDFDLWERMVYGTSSPADGDEPVATPLELAGSPAGLQFTWTRVGASPGPERSLRISIPRVQVEPFDDQPGTDGAPMTRTVTYRAYPPVGGGAAITAVLRNGTAAYTGI